MAFENTYHIREDTVVVDIESKGKTYEAIFDKDFIYVLIGLNSNVYIDISNRNRKQIPYACVMVFGKKIKIHHIVCNTANMVDHINRNSLDNRLCNLRSTNFKDNNINREPFTNTKEKYISKCKNNKYYFSPYVDGKTINGGYYNTLEEAKMAKNKFFNEGDKIICGQI